MVISSTSAVLASIQAVSPVSIFGPSACARAGAAVAPSSARAVPAASAARGAGSILISPVLSVPSWGAAARAGSQRRLVRLAGADAERPLHVQHEDLAVADLLGAGGRGDRVHHGVHQLRGHDDLDLDLRQEAHLVLGAPVDLRPPL